MKAGRLLADMTARYTPGESWVYDAMIAPAVVSFIDQLDFDIVGRAKAGDRVLDVGCGGGHILRALAERREDVTLQGVDLSHEQIGRARKRLAGFGDRVQVETGNAMDLPLEDQIFDIVYSCASIKHWPDQALGLAECARVLKPGGQLVIVEADRGCTHHDALAFVKRWRIPRTARALLLMFFRTYVAGQSIDMEDARRHAEQLPLESWRVERIQGTPGLVLEGVKAQVS